MQTIRWVMTIVFSLLGALGLLTAGYFILAAESHTPDTEPLGIAAGVAGLAFCALAVFWILVSRSEPGETASGHLTDKT